MQLRLFLEKARYVSLRPSRSSFRGKSKLGRDRLASCFDSRTTARRASTMSSIYPPRHSDHFGRSPDLTVVARELRADFAGLPAPRIERSRHTMERPNTNRSALIRIIQTIPRV